MGIGNGYQMDTYRYWVDEDRNAQNEIVWDRWTREVFEKKEELFRRNASEAETKAELDDLARRQAAQREEQERARRAAAERWNQATHRARSCLESHLDEQQRLDLHRNGRFYVIGSRGRRYCIRTTGQAGNVDWVDEEGRVQGSFCCHPSGLPDPDAWLSQMLNLMADEDHFLATANVSAGVRPL